MWLKAYHNNDNSAGLGLGPGNPGANFLYNDTGGIKGWQSPDVNGFLINFFAPNWVEEICFDHWLLTYGHWCKNLTAQKKAVRPLVGPPDCAPDGRGGEAGGAAVAELDEARRHGSEADPRTAGKGAPKKLKVRS